MSSRPQNLQAAALGAPPPSTAEAPDAADSTAAALAALQQRLLDYGPPTCITDAAGRELYANAAYRDIAEALRTAGFDPAQGDVREVSTLIDGGMRRYAVHRHAVPGAGGQGPVTALVFEPMAEAGSSGLALAAAHERLDDITRLVSDWVWEANPELVLTFVSPRVNEALGLHPMELTGQALPDLLLQPNETLARLVTPAGRQPFRNLAVQIADRRGQVRHFLLSGLPVYCQASGSFRGFRGTAHDVTDLRWREEALLGAKEAAELANRAKSEFLANMSHELRTPLNAIIGFSEIMIHEMFGPVGNEQYKGYAHDITDSARHLLQLINDILDAAKIEAGQMMLAEEVIEVRALLESVRRLMAPRAARAGLSLKVQAAPDLPRIYADKTKLKQIVINLTANAVKFTNGGGRVELRAERAASGEFLVQVSDTGIGIEPKDIPRALAPFGQVDSQLTRRFEGTGLGLPLAKSLTEMHGGKFELTSEPNVGTTVTVRLPAARVLEL